MSGRIRIACQVLAAVAAVAAWQIASSSGLVDSFYVGTPSDVAAVLRGWIHDGSLFSDLGVTLTAFSLGWLLGNLAGIAAGAVLAASPNLLTVVSPFLAFLNATPRLVFYPFFGLMLGFTLASKVALVVFVIVVFVILDVLTALATVDRDLVAQVRVLGGGRMALVSQVYRPALLDSLVGSSRVTLSFALQATLISEYFGPAKGLGARIVAGQGAFAINEVWAALLVTLALALVFDGLLQLLRHRSLNWSRS
jgi:ABC-type nitrate/sulfonate/bicarbonate transport system permease component